MTETRSTAESKIQNWKEKASSGKCKAVSESELDVAFQYCKIWVAAAPWRPLLECTTSQSSMRPRGISRFFEISKFYPPIQEYCEARSLSRGKDSEWKYCQDMLKGMPLPLWEYSRRVGFWTFKSHFCTAMSCFSIYLGVAASWRTLSQQIHFLLSRPNFEVPKKKENYSSCISPQFSSSPLCLVLQLQTAIMTIAFAVSFDLCGSNAKQY